MTLIHKSYPIFEADQVLSQKHLNQLICYLEEQDRVSRVQLLGMGLVCGLDITKPTATTLHIDCGVGITSLGFLLPFEATTFTHFKTVNLSDSFLNPDIEAHTYLNNLYQYTNLYTPFETSLELLPSDADDEDKVLLTEAILENKIVMLLVEALLIDEKNCVALDCDDKGKRLEFKIRPLLVDADALSNTEFKLNDCNRIYFDHLVLPRYNVPRKALTRVSDLLGGYRNSIIKAIPLINNSFNVLHDYYADSFSAMDNYIRLHNVSGRLNSVFNQHRNGFYLQYVWDWMHDLVATYNEIAQFYTCNPSICCPKYSLFPFHILLGSAEFETEEILYDSDLFKFRTPFIKTGILGEEERTLKQELKGLIEKLIRQIGTFDLNLEAVIEKGITITPSCSGKTPLSEKAMPYYYSEIVELNKTWSPKLTLKNQNTTILGYHADQYNTTAPYVTNPLNYNIQNYDFFRIEGHIGEEYTKAITEVTALQEQYGLPFKVVGVNAVDDEGRTVIFNNDGDTWDDLEIEYDLAKTKLINTAEFILNWLKSNKTAVQQVYSIFNDAFLASLENTVNEFKTLLTEDLTEFLENYQTFYDALEKLNDIFLLHNFCIDLVQANNDSAVLQEIENRLDEFNTIVLEDAFTVIYEQAVERWVRGVRSTFLSEFSKKHPALEHEAGVVKGGTFVMIYSDYSIFQRTASPVFIAPLFFQFANDHIGMFDYSVATVDKITNNNVLRKRKTHNPYLNAYRVDDTDPCADNVTKAVSDYDVNISNYVANNFNPVIAAYIGANLRPNFRPRPTAPSSDTAVQKKIVADFYLPYICCSEGDNINIVLPPTETEDIVADFDGADFDENDFFTNDQ
ncbi:hypothetical protein MHTCC0001_19990 [Flavobacteriaceae bacterium MHTCC 0001]